MYIGASSRGLLPRYRRALARAVMASGIIYKFELFIDGGGSRGRYVAYIVPRIHA